MKELIDSYGHHFFVSCQMLGDKKVIKLDLNIKSYRAFMSLDDNTGNMWKEFSFPDNTTINDCLYFDEELIGVLNIVLDDFIANGYLSQDYQQSTRGFKFTKLVDVNNNEISLQESSNVNPSIWFGTNTEKNIFILDEQMNLVPFNFAESDVVVEDRLHLNQKDAIKFKKVIQNQWSIFKIPKKTLKG